VPHGIQPSEWEACRRLGFKEHFRHYGYRFHNIKQRQPRTRKVLYCRCLIDYRFSLIEYILA